MQSPVRSRIAPTPSGFLHLGNALSFILTWLWVRKEQGELLLRIDDLDSARCRPEYVEDIFQSLEWLEIDYDLGPSGPEDFYANYSQHFRIDKYHALLDQLKASGDLYACVCSRKQIRESSTDGRYPGTCRELGLSFGAEQTAWRIRVPRPCQIRWEDGIMDGISVDLHAQMGDFVVRRKDGLPAYQLASLADDIAWQINLIVRGEDLINSTAAQLYLAQPVRANLFMKSRFVHHPLLLDTTGQKLSKSEGVLSLQKMQKQGASARKVWQTAAKWLGLPAVEVSSLQELLDQFREWPGSYSLEISS